MPTARPIIVIMLVTKNESGYACPIKAVAASAITIATMTSPAAPAANGSATRRTTSGPSRESVDASRPIRARLAGSLTEPCADVTTTISVSALWMPIVCVIRSLALADSGLETNATLVVVALDNIVATMANETASNAAQSARVRLGRAAAARARDGGERYDS